MNKSACLMVLFLMILSMGINAEYRYTEHQFDSVEVTSGVIYGTAPFLNSSYYNENSFTAGRIIKNIKNFTGIEAYFDSKNMKTGIYYIKVSSLKKPIKISLIK
ncbi:TPA: hypothetical protein DCW38_02650 [candidate division WOR-3 bacterium]|jgi:hypothetical protein|uniref:T9SS type A sorting domain-containing protein n=1 Tax=candidate division WOR-3 bacterium TaxID=2052148 RepID=A0A350H946_UNCW3|nr:hypothetical protein [candidate division WOR-3 bacterium]